MTATSATIQNVTWSDVTFDPTGHSPSDLGEGRNDSERVCGDNPVPTTQWFINNLTQRQLILLVVYSICCGITLLLYLEQTVFIIRRFSSNKERRQKTIWILAVFPVFSLTGLLGFMIPLAAPIVDLVANTYMAACLYNMLELMVGYLGGHDGLWNIIEEDQLTVQFATLPVCCLLPCLPKKKLDKVLMRRLRLLVLQVCIIRPILMFIAAVLWANGTYTHDGLDLKTGDPYITIINSLTTIIAVFGLNLCKTALIRPLRGFALGGKVFIIQMVLATCSLSPAITKLFDRWGLVRCDPVYIQRLHLDSIYRGILVISMLLYSITARFLYRRATDGTATVTSYIPEPEPDLKTRIKRMLNVPRDALARMCGRKERRKAMDASNGRLPIAEENQNFLDINEHRESLAKSRSWLRSGSSSPRRSGSSSPRDEAQMRYMDDTIDENTSLTMEDVDTDSELDVSYGGTLHANVNQSLVFSNSE